MLKIGKYVTPSPEQWEMVIEGMRNPMNSWDKSDSYITDITDCEGTRTIPATFHLGEKDRELMLKLVNGGSVHAKFRRMIDVMVTITAPLYWWKEFDTYKVGTVRNSCSTMHKIQEKEFTLENFSHEHLIPEAIMDLESVIDTLNRMRKTYITVKADIVSDHDYVSKDYWWQMIQLLPSSYNQTATVSLNYETLAAIYHWRRNHKLDEWHTFCDWIETLPYSEVITAKSPIIGVDLAEGSDFSYTITTVKTDEEAIKEVFDAIDKNQPKDGYLPL